MKVLFRVVALALVCLVASCTEEREVSEPVSQGELEHIERIKKMEEQVQGGAAPLQAPPANVATPGASSNP